MKLFKKVLAMALASALALTLLVGCGKDAGKTTFTVVDYLNDWSAMEGFGVTYKADTALDTNAKNVAAFVKQSGKSIDEFSSILGNVIHGYGASAEDKKLAADFAKAVGVTDETKDKYLYEVSYAVSDPKLTTDTAKDNFGFMQAQTLSFANEVNRVDKSKLEKTTYVGTTTAELDGQKYIVAVFRTAVKTAK
mgnify:CR=1 FL=1